MSEQDAWYRRFFDEEYLLFDDHPDTVQEVGFVSGLIGPAPGARVLDLCCGYGRHCVPLADLGFNVVGLDLSSTMLREAKRRREAVPKGQAAEVREGGRRRRRARESALRTPVPGACGRLELLRGDIRNLPFGSCFDAVISMFTSIGYFEDEAENFRVLKEISQVLKPGGRVLIETVNREAIIRHFRPAQVYRTGGLTVIEERQFDLASGRSRVDVTVLQGGRQTRLHHDIRVFSFTELQMLLMANGMKVVGLWGDFTGGELSWNSASMIVLAQKGL